MSKNKPFFITFEGVEGSGKSYQCKKLLINLKKKKFNCIFTREPGGSVGAEKIRKIILQGAKNKFSLLTDTLLYLAARNEHIENTIKPSLNKKKIIICDRFVDSTIAYQVYGSGVNKYLVNVIHKIILGKIKPNFTIVLKVTPKKAFNRLKKRKYLNRYDKFPKKFYNKVQNAFIKIANNNKKRYLVIDNTADSQATEKIILNKVLKKLNK